MQRQKAFLRFLSEAPRVYFLSHAGFTTFTGGWKHQTSSFNFPLGLQGKEAEEEDDVAVAMDKDRFMDDFFVQVL